MNSLKLYCPVSELVRLRVKTGLPPASFKMSWNVAGTPAWAWDKPVPKAVVVTPEAGPVGAALNQAANDVAGQVADWVR